MHLKPSLCVKNISYIYIFHIYICLRNGGSVGATSRFTNELVLFTSFQRGWSAPSPLHQVPLFCFLLNFHLTKNTFRDWECGLVVECELDISMHKAPGTTPSPTVPQRRTF